jgi:hypothetical protein
VSLYALRLQILIWTLEGVNPRHVVWNFVLDDTPNSRVHYLAIWEVKELPLLIMPYIQRNSLTRICLSVFCFSLFCHAEILFFLIFRHIVHITPSLQIIISKSCKAGHFVGRFGEGTTHNPQKKYGVVILSNGIYIYIYITFVQHFMKIYHITQVERQYPRQHSDLVRLYFLLARKHTKKFYSCPFCEFIR